MMMKTAADLQRVFLFFSEVEREAASAAMSRERRLLKQTTLVQKYATGVPDNTSIMGYNRGAACQKCPKGAKYYF